MHCKWKLESNLFLWVDWEEKESCNHLQSCQGQSREPLQLLHGSNILICSLRRPEMYICYSKSGNETVICWNHCGQYLYIYRTPAPVRCILQFSHHSHHRFCLFFFFFLLFLMIFKVLYKKSRLSCIFNAGEQRQINVIICPRFPKWISGRGTKLPHSSSAFSSALPMRGWSFQIEKPCKES